MADKIMLKEKIKGTDVSFEKGITVPELAYCFEYAKKRLPKTSFIKELVIKRKAEGGYSVDWKIDTHFERIRRITGYLVGDVNRWNDAKRAEEHDRVKHGLASAHV